MTRFFLYSAHPLLCMGRRHLRPTLRARAPSAESTSCPGSAQKDGGGRRRRRARHRRLFGVVATIITMLCGKPHEAFTRSNIRGLHVCHHRAAGRGIAAVLGIYGDLFASVVKRQCGISDYGTIFPGHGGILDRFDSAMLIAPFACPWSSPPCSTSDTEEETIMSKKITLLGSTGSIGTQSLDVIRAQGYEVYGLSAHSHVEKILQQIEEFHQKYVFAR